MIVAAAYPGWAGAQTYPSRIVTLVVRFTPGDSTEIKTVLAAPEIAERLSQEGAEVWMNSPTEFREHISREMVRWGDLVKRTGIKPE